MGLFNRSKKNKADKNHQLDLSNPIIKKMVDWIEHPMEFGKKPDSIEIVDQRSLFWPSRKNEDCYLLKYTVDDKEYIGFTGPISWSFFFIDLSKVSYEDLYIRYTGWYIAFYTTNADNYDKSLEGSNEKAVIESLQRSGLSEIKTLQKTLMGGDNYYEFSAEKGGQKIKMVGIENDMYEYPFDAVLPYFEYIGLSWGPFNP